MGIDILGVDIMGVDILGIDIPAPTRLVHYTTAADSATRNNYNLAVNWSSDNLLFRIIGGKLPIQSEITQG